MITRGLSCIYCLYMYLTLEMRTPVKCSVVANGYNSMDSRGILAPLPALVSGNIYSRHSET